MGGVPSRGSGPCSSGTKDHRAQTPRGLGTPRLGWGEGQRERARPVGCPTSPLSLSWPVLGGGVSLTLTSDSGTSSWGGALALLSQNLMLPGGPERVCSGDGNSPRRPGVRQHGGWGGGKAHAPHCPPWGPLPGVPGGLASGEGKFPATGAVPPPGTHPPVTSGWETWRLTLGPDPDLWGRQPPDNRSSGAGGGVWCMVQGSHGSSSWELLDTVLRGLE